MKKLLPALLLAFAIGLNLYWLFPETRARYDVNDNVFAYSLALRANEVWDKFCNLKSLSPFSCLVNLTDHWVAYWAQGYPLPHFYQHLPSILFVALYKLINLSLSLSQISISLYTIFRWVQFLTLSLFPLSLYWCARKFGLDRLTSAFTGLLSTLISTQFLYGTDLNAVTWRGSGMTTQLLGMVTLPLAIGSIYDSLVNSRSHARSALLLALTFHMHVLFGFIASLSTLLLWALATILNLYRTRTGLQIPFLKQFTQSLVNETISKREDMVRDEYVDSAQSRSKSQGKKRATIGAEKSGIKNLFVPTINLVKILLPTALLLSYWLLPLLSHSALHNTSVWDEQTKFNSYGAKTVIEKLISGDLLDANRPPVLTFLLFIGILLSLSFFFSSKKSSNEAHLEQHTDQKDAKLPFFSWLARSRSPEQSRGTKDAFQNGRLPRNESYAGEAASNNNLQQPDNLLKRAMSVFQTRPKNDIEKPHDGKFIFLFLPLLFFFWLALYFGPATWGNLFFLIPGTEGLHVHRLINGVHFASFFLIALALSAFYARIEELIYKAQRSFFGGEHSSFKRYFLSRLKGSTLQNLAVLFSLISISILLFPVFRERQAFMKQNQYLIGENLKVYESEKSELQSVVSQIKQNPGRVNAGRPGNWGKTFTTGGAENFLQLSENGISTIGWLPQSWSPFSDIEQFWNGSRLDHYELENITWAYYPLSEPLPDFAKEVYRGEKSHLGFIPSTGNFHFITVPFTAFGYKNHVLNFQRLWLESDWPKSWSSPQLVLTRKPVLAPRSSTLLSEVGSNLKSQISSLVRPPGSPVDGPDIYITDMGTAQLNGQPFNLVTSKLFEATSSPLEAFGKVGPSALPKSAKVISEVQTSPQSYKLTVETGETLALMAKFTYHPYWRVRVDGKINPTFMVAPAFLATPIPPGTHTVEFNYTTPSSKKLLLAISLLTTVGLLVTTLFHK